MDLSDQLKNLFPDHIPEEEPQNDKGEPAYWIQDEPIQCKYEKGRANPLQLSMGIMERIKTLKFLQRS